MLPDPVIYSSYLALLVIQHPSSLLLQKNPARAEALEERETWLKFKSEILCQTWGEVACSFSLVENAGGAVGGYNGANTADCPYRTRSPCNLVPFDSDFPLFRKTVPIHVHVQMYLKCWKCLNYFVWRPFHILTTFRVKKLPHEVPIKSFPSLRNIIPSSSWFSDPRKISLCIHYF